jgi:coenzyme F420-reducing hydrogenase delta subunit
MSYWIKPINYFENQDGIIEIMSENKLSPSFLIRSLARSNRGLLIIGPDKKTGSHYLTCNDNPLDVVEKTRDLLKLNGISPDRLQYLSVPNNTNSDLFLKDYSKNLDDKKIKNLEISLPKIKINPISESIMILRILSANPDIKPVDDLIKISSAKQNGIALFEGYLPLLNSIGISHKLFDLSTIRKSIHKLLKIAGIDYGLIPGLSCPPYNILNLNIKKSNEFIDKIERNNIKNYKKINPYKFIIGTPESYVNFSKLNEYKNIVTLPNILYNKLKKIKDFNTINKTVAIHQPYHLDNDPFYDATKKLLSLIPGISIVLLKEKCNHNGFNKLNSDTRENSLKIIREANEKCADMIICTSPYCESHLLLCQREGSWRTIDMDIKDVYSLILNSLDDGDK